MAYRRDCAAQSIFLSPGILALELLGQQRQLGLENRPTTRQTAQVCQQNASGQERLAIATPGFAASFEKDDVWATGHQLTLFRNTRSMSRNGRAQSPNRSCRNTLCPAYHAVLNLWFAYRHPPSWTAAPNTPADGAGHMSDDAIDRDDEVEHTGRPKDILRVWPPSGFASLAGVEDVARHSRLSPSAPRREDRRLGR
jgi:hypothetical protein